MGDASVSAGAGIDQLVADSPERIIAMLAGLLEQLIVRNDRLPVRLNHFHARSPPPISIRSYLQRFAKYAPFGNECFIIVLIYLDRIVQRCGVVVTSLNVHRLLVTGLMLASKYSQDKYYTNKHYAKVGGLPVQELNMLEIEFLLMIDFELHANIEWLERYYAQLCAHCGHLAADVAPAAAPVAPPIVPPTTYATPASQQSMPFSGYVDGDVAAALAQQAQLQQQIQQQLLLQQQLARQASSQAPVAIAPALAPRMDMSRAQFSPKRQAEEVASATSTPPRKRRPSLGDTEGSPRVNGVNGSPAQNGARAWNEVPRLRTASDSVSAYAHAGDSSRPDVDVNVMRAWVESQRLRQSPKVTAGGSVTYDAYDEALERYY
eukprot:Opistho-1_new@53948